MSELLTTSIVDPADRLDYWREVICAVYVELHVEPVNTDAFAGSVELTAWGEQKLSRVSSMGQLVTRQPGTTEDDCLVSLQVSGSCRVTQAGRTAVLTPGDFALYDATKPYELAFDDRFGQLVLQFSRDALISRNVHIESAVARTCSGATGVGAVAASFLECLAQHDAEIPEDHRRRLGDQAIDFTAVALSDAAGTTPTSESVARFNRQRVLNVVDQNLDNPDLSVAFVAAALGVSTRTIQKLFASDSPPLSARIRAARIDRAKRALSDPRRDHLTIARIANDLGFGSPTQFARVFKAASGYSPSEFRATQRN